MNKHLVKPELRGWYDNVMDVVYSQDLALASKDLGLRVLTVYGGVGYDTQLETLESGVDIVVGTPGRLIDLGETDVHGRLAEIRAFLGEDAALAARADRRVGR